MATAATPRPLRRASQSPAARPASAADRWVLVGIEALLVIYCAVVYALDTENRLLMNIAGGSVAIAFLAFFILLLRRRWAATFAFTFFVLQPVVQVFMSKYVGGADVMWPRLFPQPIMFETLRLMFVHAHVLFLLLAIALAVTEDHPPAQTAPVLNPIGTLLLMGLCLGFGVAVLKSVLVTSRADLLDNAASGGDLFVMVIGPLLIGFGASIGATAHGKLMRLLTIACVLLAVVTAMAGYRSVLVTSAIGIVAAYLTRNRISVAKLAFGAVGLVIAYYVMAYLNFIRHNHVTIVDVLSGTVKASGADVMSSAGRAEQIGLFTVHYAQQLDRTWGMTYIWSLIRVLPQGISYNMLHAIRPQDIFVNGGPWQFQLVHLNLGSYFFAESILNFGRWGSVLVTTAVVAIFAWLEQNKGRTALRQMLYPVIAMMTPTLADYGSSNFFKQTLTLLVVALVVYAIGSDRRPLVGDRLRAGRHRRRFARYGQAA